MFFLHLQKKFADLILALGGSFMERSEFPEIYHVHIAHVLDQLLSYLIVAVGTGVVQGNQSSGVLEIGERERNVWTCSTSVHRSMTL